MTITEWFLFFLAIQVVHFFGTWKLYKIAGRESWEAAVPVYNAVVLMKIINRPWWYTILLFVPIINLIMFPVIWVETLRSFGKNSIADTVLGVVTLGLYIYYVNYTQDVHHISERSLKPKSSSGEWVSSILFAVVAATIIHTFVMQPFTIPTSSLEKTLLVGDFLFVSKFHYGARTPMTTVAFPMVHDTIPVAKVKSYTNKPQLPYLRFPAFQQIKRNEIVVFNWPTDTVPYFGYRGPNTYIKPIDKKSNYVKRAVGIPGDVLEIKSGDVFVNGKFLELHDRQKLQYYHYAHLADGTANQVKNDYKVKEFFQAGEYRIRKNLWEDPRVQEFLDNPRHAQNLTETASDSLMITFSGSVSREAMERLQIQMTKRLDVLNLTNEQVERMKTDSRILSLEKYISAPGGDVFPHDDQWSVDDFGPISIPKAGETIVITLENIALYKRLIEVYEGSELGIENTITRRGNQVLLNGNPLTEYTFLMDYYWMMGDNRHNSADSRSFGFVPFNHVVGKPVLIWMSWDSNGNGIMNKIRWERLFTTVGGNGEPVSYFRYLLILLAGWFAFDFFRKKKKKKTNQ